MRVSSALGFLALASCAPAPGPGPPRAAARDAARPAEPLLLPDPTLPPAPWRSPPAASPREPWRETATARFIGVDAALAGTGAGVFAIHRRHGVVGPLRVPDGAVWLGLDGRDRVLAATQGGDLHRAAGVREAARDGAFTRVGAVPGAIAWDAGAAWIAAATPTEVWISGDGGAAFRSLGPGPGAALDRVLVRSDGAVVAQGPSGPRERTTWVGGPSRRLAPSTTRAHELMRVGGWIMDWGCPTVLSSDGARWTRLEELRSERLSPRWLDTFTPGPTLAAFAREFPGSLVDPAPPPPPPPATDAWAGGGCHRVGVPPRVSMGAVSMSLRCAGATDFAGTQDAEPPARFALALFRDGACAAAQENPDAFVEDSCEPDAPLTRPPTVAILDREAGSMTPAAVPPGCRPERLLSAADAGVLFCAAGDAAAVFVADRSGAWRPEGTLPFRAPDATSLASALDGTLLLRVAWGEPQDRMAFVRSPRPLGDAGAWRALDLSGVFELRVDVGGAALLFGAAEGARAPSWLTLARDAPGEPRRALTGRVAVEGALVDVGIEGRRVVAWLSRDAPDRACAPRAAPGHEGLARHVLAQGGQLVPVP